MAKKTASRSRAGSRADAGTEAPPATPKARGRRAPAGSSPVEAGEDTAGVDVIVVSEAESDTSVGGPGHPDEEHIRVRAYLRYLERGRADGQDFEDWIEAERELKERK